MRNNYQLDSTPLTDWEVYEKDFIEEKEPTPKWFTRPIFLMIIALICLGIYLVFRYFWLPNQLDGQAIKSSPSIENPITPAIPSTYAYQSKQTYVPEFAIQPSSSAMRQQNPKPDKTTKPTEEKKQNQIIASSKDPNKIISPPTNKRSSDKRESSSNVPKSRQPTVQKETATQEQIQSSDNSNISIKPDQQVETPKTNETSPSHKENSNESIHTSTYILAESTSPTLTLNSSKDSTEDLSTPFGPNNFLDARWRLQEDGLVSDLQEGLPLGGILVVPTITDQVIDWSNVRQTGQVLEQIVETALQNQSPAIYLDADSSIPNEVWQQLQNKLSTHHKVLGAVFSSTDHPDLIRKITSFHTLGIRHFLFLPEETSSKTNILLEVDISSLDSSQILHQILTEHSILYPKDPNQQENINKSHSSMIDPNDPKIKSGQ